MKKHVLLAVDDKPDNLYVLESLVAAHLPECELVRAASGEEGLAVPLERDLDGALVDVQMPGMSGIEMCRRIKQDERTAHVPVILITAYRADAALKAEGLQAGADDFLTKPIDNVELVAKIKVMLRAKKTKDALRDSNAQLEDLIAERTEKLRDSEEQLRQSQKLEAIGRLAGGVAHDFNNILTGIKGYAKFALGELQEGTRGHEDIMEAIRLADRAADLTRQLLAFGRRQTLTPVVTSLNALISGLAKMLKRLIGEDIDMRFVPAPDVRNVKVDGGQIEQVLMNLAVNARDAMPGGGKLTIETANASLCESYASAHVGVKPGLYSMIGVTDTGCGMDVPTQQQAFEPFFTTKEVGRGTGLGLSTAYGIVKQHGGNIWLYSEPGHGTTFKVYLPSVTERAADVVTKETEEDAPGGTETILFVEDEAAVLAVGERMLTALGYEVLTASSPAEAREKQPRHEGKIDLLLADVIMPGSSGRELFDDLREKRQDLKVLYISGYTDAAIVHHGVLDSGTPFLQKPFTAEGLARKVREVLDDAGVREETCPERAAVNG